LDLSFSMRRVNGVNPIGRLWNLLCNLDRDVANFRPFRLTDGNPSVNIDGILSCHGFMV
jgi:hypothetical protein